MIESCFDDCCRPEPMPPLPSEEELRATAAANPGSFLAFLIDGADRYDAELTAQAIADANEPWGDE